MDARPNISEATATAAWWAAWFREGLRADSAVLARATAGDRPKQSRHPRVAG